MSARSGAGHGDHQPPLVDLGRPRAVEEPARGGRVALERVEHLRPHALRVLEVGGASGSWAGAAPALGGSAAARAGAAGAAGGGAAARGAAARGAPASSASTRAASAAALASRAGRLRRAATSSSCSRGSAPPWRMRTWASASRSSPRTTWDVGELVGLGLQAGDLLGREGPLVARPGALLQQADVAQVGHQAADRLLGVDRPVEGASGAARRRRPRRRRPSGQPARRPTRATPRRSARGRRATSTRPPA